MKEFQNFVFIFHTNKKKKKREKKTNTQSFAFFFFTLESRSRWWVSRPGRSPWSSKQHQYLFASLWRKTKKKGRRKRNLHKLLVVQLAILYWDIGSVSNTQRTLDKTHTTYQCKISTLHTQEEGGLLDLVFVSLDDGAIHQLLQLDVVQVATNLCIR